MPFIHSIAYNLICCRKCLLLAFFAPLAMLLLAAGCSPEKSEDPVEIVFWHAWNGHEGKFMKELIDEFNRTHPHIKVKASSFVIGDKLMAAIAGGIPPDVATIWDWMLPTMGEAGCFMPLNNWLAESGITKEDYLPHIWECGMFSDKKYGVPTTLNVTMLYYNNNLLREAGLPPNQGPKTLDELTEWGEKLSKTDADGRISRIGFMPSSPFIWFWNFGGDIYDPVGKRLCIDSPANLRALEWMESFYRKYGIDNYRRFTSTFGESQSPNNPFYKGKIAIWEDGQWQMRFIQEYAIDLDYGIAPIPTVIPGQESVTISGNSFWAIPVGCPHPEEAWTFLHWLISPEQSARFAAALYNIPPMEEALNHPAYQELMKTRMKDFVDLLRAGRTRYVPALPLGQQLTAECNQVLELVFSGAITPKEGLATLQKRLQKSLDRALLDAELYKDLP